ncbi:hypothetical protein SPRG_06878 [Saprolegnia parasitica CBS 223.65]|uniref:Uncharacterized protein n=1 Tax=Saprolegnia parasitica (strain CBS 223.65) TaxID=695850 RepID=A0A067CEK4_SAPPC|nr:hypothetical protein SPRG_06878 [Saprolegnia parasitica CBS 223.65]KDO27610.1 hypothetical protein SPRG_06878 [Saprolegnia parasitica CBS 223.65]|eukprot:XP_012201732.1 hypothetical protein SPRG_06878 [Saprolegnia parasitica CBS 223.65]
MDTASSLLTSLPLPLAMDATSLFQWVVLLAAIAITFLHVARSRQAAPSLKGRLKRRMSTLGWATKESETDSNRSIPLTITVLDGIVARETLVAHFHERMTSDKAFFYRFISRVDDGNFVIDSSFDAGHHITEHVLVDNETPHDIAESLANKELDPSLPLWAITMLHHDDKTWLVWRIHHCIGDGASLSLALFKLSDATEMPTLPTMPAPTTKPPRTPLYVVVASILWSTFLYVRKFVNMVVFPEPRTVLKQTGHTRKRLGYTLAFSIADTKAVGKHFKATLNDVLVSCIAGALRKTIEAETNAPVAPSLSLRAGIPVNMRGLRAIEATSNDFSSLVIDLPVGEANPSTRMRLVARRLAEAKFSLEKNFTRLVSLLIMSLPRDLMRHGVHWSASNVSIAITNVRGPPMEIYFCGQRLSASYAFVPPPPSVNVGVAITSWGTSLGVTVLMDTSIKQTPTAFIAAIEAEFQALRASLKLD